MERQMQAYDPTDWYWLVAGDDSRAWSSAAAAYVEMWPADRVTRIASEAELDAVLAPYWLAGPADPWKMVRRRRNDRLSASDWTQLQDTALSPEVAQKWRAYRQALRDITDTFASPATVEWPQEPSS